MTSNSKINIDPSKLSDKELEGLRKAILIDYERAEQQAKTLNDFYWSIIVELSRRVEQ